MEEFFVERFFGGWSLWDRDRDGEGNGESLRRGLWWQRWRRGRQSRGSGRGQRSRFFDIGQPFGRVFTNPSLNHCAFEKRAYRA